MWHQLTSIIMSNVFMRLFLEGAVVLIATIPVLLGAPTTSLPDIQQQSLALDLAQCGKDFYWDSEKEECLPCLFCPEGMGSTASTCGDGLGEKGICMECVDGETFQDQTSTKDRCNRCRRCDSNASVLTTCTKYSDTQCGPCNDGYGRDPNHSELCSLCDYLNDDEKPPECLITTTPTPPVIEPDIDECALNQNTCDTSVSTCNNTIGSYTCECLHGYVKDRLDKCTDINECDLRDSCDDSVSRCNNTNGSYTCDCFHGFEMKSSHCVDVNECELPLDLCDTSTARCNNTNGSYACDCLHGFEMKSSSQCVDVNECELHLDSCDDSVSRCSNTNGNYTCDCLPGFEMKSSHCVGNGGSGTNVVFIVVPSGVLLFISLLLAIWYCRKKYASCLLKGEEVPATSDELTAITTSHDNETRRENDPASEEVPATSDDNDTRRGNDPAPSPNDSGSRDSTASVTSDSSHAISNSNRQSLTPAETQQSGAPDAGQDEREPLLVKAIRPSMASHDEIEMAPTGAQEHDPQTANGNISNHVPDIPGDVGDEVEETNIDTELNDDGALTGAQGHDSPTANANILNCRHVPDTLGYDGEEVVDADVNLSTEESAKSDETRDALATLPKIGCSAPVRPGFNRSQSVPATSSKRNESPEKEDKASPILPENTQKKLVKMAEKDKKDKAKEEFQTALRLGKDIQWKDFGMLFRNKVSKNMIHENEDKSYKAFGELMGLKRTTNLKVCKDLNDVFIQLEESQITEVFMDKALLILREMERNDIVRVIIREMINNKPTCRGE